MCFTEGQDLGKTRNRTDSNMQNLPARICVQHARREGLQLLVHSEGNFGAANHFQHWTRSNLETIWRTPCKTKHSPNQGLKFEWGATSYNPVAVVECLHKHAQHASAREIAPPLNPPPQDNWDCFWGHIKTKMALNIPRPYNPVWEQDYTETADIAWVQNSAVACRAFVHNAQFEWTKKP